MYSVMIVDDEATIREKLPMVIPFAQCGFHVTATAKNGVEALELLPAHEPDLILLDVRMPVMDGLTFLERLRESRYRDTPVIILSGYSDFEYAKRAMGQGVKAYLTKPVDEDEAAARLREIAEELSLRGDETKRRRYRKSISLLRRAYSESTVVASMPDYLLLHLVLRKVETGYSGAHPYQLINGHMAAKVGMEEEGLLRKEGCIYSFLLPVETLNCGASRSKTAFAETLRRELLSVGIDCAVLLDMLTLSSGQISFRKSFLKHLDGLMTQLFYTDVSFAEAHPGAETGRQFKHSGHLDDIYEELRRNLADINAARVTALIEQLCDDIREAKLDTDELQNITNRLYYLFTEIMSSLERDGSEPPMLSRMILKELPTFHNFYRWREMLTEQVGQVLTFLAQRRKMLGMGVSRELLEYVYSNYRSQLSLRQVAEQFHMNPAYLGRVFQRATGVSFKQYVTRLRMDEAKRLLQSTDKLIYEIAEEVGFSGSSYFIERFTEEEGVSPLEFRKR